MCLYRVTCPYRTPQIDRRFDESLSSLHSEDAGSQESTAHALPVCSRRKVDGTALPPCNAFLSVYVLGRVAVRRYDSRKTEDKPMAWTTPVLVEICIGLEINGYLPAEF